MARVGRRSTGFATAGPGGSRHSGRCFPGGIYNLCDDEPAPNSEVVAYAAGLLGIPSPPEVSLEDAGLSATAMRFYGESKRVSNALAKAELGWRPAYPTFREGLAAILATEVS